MSCSSKSRRLQAAQKKELAEDEREAKRSILAFIEASLQNALLVDETELPAFEVYREHQDLDSLTTKPRNLIEKLQLRSAGWYIS
jgi:hypothetical protein